MKQLAEVRRVQAETKRIYSVCFSERFENPATVKAANWFTRAPSAASSRLSASGRIAFQMCRVVPAWFFERPRYGGILNDIGSHQIDQFLYFTSSTSGEIVASQVANYHHPQFPEVEDFGDMTLRSDHATGYVRVDWFTPDGLGVWGDVRLFLLGTDGYIELRKNIDIAGLQGANHLYMVTQTATQYIDCTGVELPYGQRLIADILNRTETAMTQAHCFLASELALKAAAQAQRISTSPQ